MGVRLGSRRPQRPGLSNLVNRCEQLVGRKVQSTASRRGRGPERASGRAGDIRVFAERFDELSSWASWFTKAENLLDDPAPTAPYHRDLLPLDATLDRRQLAASVVQGWVFGGMGSWNDGGLADPAAQSEYERVGANLYSSLLAALPAAANGA